MLDRGLDQGTAFGILSIDIADVDLGENRGAALRSSQAAADKEVAQAQAEFEELLRLLWNKKIKPRYKRCRPNL